MSTTKEDIEKQIHDIVQDRLRKLRIISTAQVAAQNRVDRLLEKERKLKELTEELKKRTDSIRKLQQKLAEEEEARKRTEKHLTVHIQSLKSALEENQLEDKQGEDEALEIVTEQLRKILVPRKPDVLLPSTASKEVKKRPAQSRRAAKRAAQKQKIQEEKEVQNPVEAQAVTQQQVAKRGLKRKAESAHGPEQKITATDKRRRRETASSSSSSTTEDEAEPSKKTVVAPPAIAEIPATQINVDDLFDVSTLEPRNLNILEDDLYLSDELSDEA